MPTNEKYLISELLDYPPFKPTRHGPFSVGNNLFVVGLYNAPAASTFFLSVFRSSDAGLTWSELDAANRPQTVSSILRHNYSVILVGAFFYVSYVATDSTLRIIRFDASSSSWEEPTSAGPTPRLSVEWIMDDGGSCKNFVALHSATGRVYVHYQGAVEVVGPNSYERSWLTYYSGGVWSAPVMMLASGVALDVTPNGMLEDAGGNLQLIASGYDRSSVNPNYIYGVTIDAAFTVGPTQTIAANLNKIAEPRTGQPVLAPNGAVMFPYLSAASPRRIVMVSADSGSAPVWTLDTVLGSDPSDLFMGADIAFDSDSTPYAIWQRDYYQIWFAKRVSGAWSTPELFAEYTGDGGEHVLASGAEGSIYLVFFSTDPVRGQYFLEFLAATPVPIDTSAEFVLSGVKRYRDRRLLLPGGIGSAG